MKKSLFTTAILLTVLTGFSQAFIQAGAGYSIKQHSPSVELFAGGVFRETLVLAAGIQTPTQNVKTIGCQFQGKMGIQIWGVSKLILTPYFGISQFYRSSDNKSLNVTRPLYALDIALPMNDDRGKLYVGASLSGESVLISGGIRFSFATLD